MTTDKLASVFALYRRWITDVHNVVACRCTDDFGATHLGHLAWMCDEANNVLIPNGKVEKAMRWLGYVQGVLVARGLFTLSQVKEHSMPDEEKRVK